MKRAHRYCLFGALLVGLLVRIPGVFWGYNFPTEWYGHHVDEYTHLVNAEMLINPLLPPRWPPHPYPKGMGAHVAVLMLGEFLLEGKLVGDPEALRNLKPPPPSKIIVTGRVVSVLYGTATIFVVFLLGRRLFGDARVATAAAGLFALGGLHVSQSHFFLSDVPGLFWLLLGSYLLFLDVDAPDKKSAHFLLWAAFCFGAAFGLKLVIQGLPTLGLIAIMQRPRLLRAIHAGIFFLAGFVVVNFGAYSPYDLLKSLIRGVGDPYQFSFLSNLWLYPVGLPSVVSLPVALLVLAGSYWLARKLFLRETREQAWPLVLIVILPLLISVFLIVFKLDHFPRHIIPFIPWISLVAAWSLIRIGDALRTRGLHPALLIVPLFFYLAIFIYDGERVFIQEPRNKAADWILQKVTPGTTISWRGHGLKGYGYANFPEEGRPPVVVVEMHHANHYLSGMSWRNSYPSDYKFIFDSRSQARIDALQSLFKGSSEYKEVARFSEGYCMPEYVLVDHLIGNRSRNYVAEIVVFAQANGLDTEAGQ